MDGDAEKPIWDVITSLTRSDAKGKQAAVFTSYTVQGNAAENLRQRLKQIGCSLELDDFYLQGSADSASIERMLAYGFGAGCAVLKIPNPRKPKLVKCLVCGEVFDASLGTCPVCGVGLDQCVPVEADVLTVQGAVCGVICFHVPSGKVIVVRSKAVILATGTGSYKPTGYPTGGDTFDGEYIAYQLGLPIAGKEFEDFHHTPASAPGNVFADNHWQYLENIWLCSGDVSPENARDYAATKGNIMVMGRNKTALAGMADADGSAIQNVATASYTRRGGSRVYESDPEEKRSGKMSTPVVASGLPGAAVGMSCHLTADIFCGLDDLTGYTGISGLYTAGDGIHATSPSGAAYPCGVGFTSCFTSIDGTHAGKAAAEFAARSELLSPSDEQIELKTQDLIAPLLRTSGFDANWARDILQSIMAPYWVNTAKTEATLQAALVNVMYLWDYVLLQPRPSAVYRDEAQSSLR